MRTALDNGSGSVTSLVMFGAVVMLGLGGLGGAAVILRVTDAIRTAELTASAVATRALSGDTTPCNRSCRTGPLAIVRCREPLRDINGHNRNEDHDDGHDCDNGRLIWAEHIVEDENR